MIDLDEYRQLKENAERLRRDADRAQGAYEQHLAKLKEERGVKTVKEAKELEKKLAREEAELEAEFKKVYAPFKEKWGHLLGDDMD